jgi:hypothetical protein
MWFEDDGVSLQDSSAYSWMLMANG